MAVEGSTFLHIKNIHFCTYNGVENLSWIHCDMSFRGVAVRWVAIKYMTQNKLWINQSPRSLCLCRTRMGICDDLFCNSLSFAFCNNLSVCNKNIFDKDGAIVLWFY